MIITILRYSLYILMLSVFFLVGCEKDPVITYTNNDVALSSEDDKKIGAAIDLEFIKHIDTSSTAQLYHKDKHEELYQVLDNLIAKAVNTHQLANGLLFDWTVRVFDEPDNEQILVAPGGYIYITKDMLQLLNSEAQLFVLLAHAMANIDKRYITKKLEEDVSIRYLEDLALGGQIDNMSSILKTIRHPNYDSTEVHIMEEQAKAIACANNYSLSSYADFITQITQVIKKPIEWADTYPADPNRTSALYNHQKDEPKCKGELIGLDFYKYFRSLL